MVDCDFRGLLFGRNMLYLGSAFLFYSGCSETKLSKYDLVEMRSYFIDIDRTVDVNSFMVKSRLVTKDGELILSFVNDGKNEVVLSYLDSGVTEKFTYELEGPKMIPSYPSEVIIHDRDLLTLVCDRHLVLCRLSDVLVPLKKMPYDTDGFMLGRSPSFPYNSSIEDDKMLFYKLVKGSYSASICVVSTKILEIERELTLPPAFNPKLLNNATKIGGASVGILAPNLCLQQGLAGATVWYSNEVYLDDFDRIFKLNEMEDHYSDISTANSLSSIMKIYAENDINTVFMRDYSRNLLLYLKSIKLDEISRMNRLLVFDEKGVFIQDIDLTGSLKSSIGNELYTIDVQGDMENRGVIKRYKLEVE